MVLEILTSPLSVCRLAGPVPPPETGLFFLSQTDREWSLVCPTPAVPGNCLDREDGWRAFRVAGTLDFSLVGVLAGLLRVLERESISVFVQSTYCTDYVLVKETQWETALTALGQAGYTIR